MKIITTIIIYNLHLICDPSASIERISSIFSKSKKNNTRVSNRVTRLDEGSRKEGRQKEGGKWKSTRMIFGQGRGFLPGCDIETGTGEKETRWWPGSQWGRTRDRFIEAATSKGFARTGKWNFHYRNTSHCQ